MPHINIAELVGYERGRKEEREIAEKKLKKEREKTQQERERVQQERERVQQERERVEHERLVIARNLKALGLSLEMIVEATGLAASEVDKL
ncbi:MAG: hypothetical protein WC423_22705 [Vulcanimicrobiota bacterium]